MIGPWNTVRINEPLANSYLDEVGRFRVVQLAEGNYLAHGHVVPVGEWTDDMRYFATFNRLKMRINISHTIHFLPVIFPTVRIFDF